MSNLLIQFLFLITSFVSLNSEVQRTRPSIKTEDGDLIIEPAFGKNIYFRPNGPKSTVYIGDVNLLTANLSSSDIAPGKSNPNSNIDFERTLHGPNGIIERLQWLESRQLQPLDLQQNITALWRKVNRLLNRVNVLQTALTIRDRDDCSSRPCLNGGTCLNLFNGYHCLCPSNWEGKNCDVDVNECRNFIGTDLGCQNGATCKNLPGSYECQCRSGWYGIHCTRRAKDCNGGNFEMCGHGTCISVDTGEGIKCICDQGWTTNGTSVACLTDVNECESYRGAHCSVNPTVECINTPGSFKCGDCPAGYEGDGYICSDIDECLTIPNGGCSTSPFVTCHNTIGSRICGACPTGYEGDGVTCNWRGSCAINRGGCHPSAQCIDNPAGGQIAQCVCPPGLEGDGVGINGCYVPTGNYTRGCDSNPCGIHGQCHPLRTGYTCICHRGYGGARCDATSDYCRRNPCLNGGRCIPDESTARGFRCECTSQFSGDVCHVAAKTCGGLLPHQEGTISYPLTNRTYNHNSRCAWVIQTSRDKVINVTFSKFDLEENHDCAYDFLQIHDGRSSASQLIGRFCGKNFPKGGNIISSQNTLYFWFKSDQSVAKNGFTLHWTTINPQCGGELDATKHGQISSPGSPGKYPPNRDCYWHLATTLGKRIQLHFFALDIESHPNCSFDYLAIYDGQSETDPLLSKFCNSTHPAPIQSAGSDILIHFHSDAYESGFGFQIAFAPTDGVPGCGGLYTTEYGELSSPSHNGKYLSNMLCEYKIKTSPDTKIELQFNLFELESSFRCIYDYVKIYDGPTEESRLVGKFCGKTFPKTFTSSSNQLLLIFRSDQSMTQGGFRISYAAKCQYTILGDTGVIKSPGYPSNYPADRVCEYILGTSPGKAIQLTFQDFDIEDNTHYNCRYDNLEIRDGINANATSLGKFCGGISRIPATITSTHNYLFLKFTSDISVSGTGFYANFTSIDIECGGIYRERSGIINHPSADKEKYSNDQTCKWILIAPRGMYIKVTWNRFDLENMPQCHSDYVTLDEIDENNEPNNFGKFCGRVIPPSITTSENQMQITFVSDNSLTSGGFSLSYTFLDGKKHCSGTFSKTHGFIYSPGWPKAYDNYRDCTWIIKAPAGQQIRLNISQFHLEPPIRNSCDNGDYLEIRNGEQPTSPLFGKYCGRFQSKRVISMGNTLLLRFHSDSYLTGGGFVIEWDSALTGCGGTMNSSSGVITSPNYPNHYGENAECFYKIVSSAGSQIQITFTDIDLEETMDCKDDFIQIFDGRNTNSPSMGKYCRMVPELRLLKSTSNHVVIKFRSDFFLGGKGFSLRYDSVCQTNLTGFHGIIESPGYPGAYETGLNCLWTINVPKGNKINITFTGFSISYTNWPVPRLGFHSFTYTRFSSANRYCGLDYMQIKETSDVNFGEKLCGSTSPGRLSSKTNSLQIKFVSSSRSPLNQGFRLEWARFGCGGYIKKNYGMVKIDRTLASSGELECEWIIETEVGKSVTLDVTDNYMSETPNCTVDAIEVYNGNTINAPLLTKICHKGAISSVTATSNIMLVRFVKRSTLRDVYFSSHFNSWLDGCGGQIESLFGVIHSKNYPRNYDNDLNCLWVIKVPNHYRIEFNFMDFDLYSVSAADTEECADSVQIYDGQFTLNRNYTQRLCPNSESTQFISKYNMMGIKFSSDDYGTAKGFKANFTVTCGATLPLRYDGIISIDSWHTTHVSKNCTWTLLAPTPDKKVSLTITYMSIPKNTDIITNRKCPSSFLRIYDGDDDKSPVVEEYCGKKIPPTIVSHGSALTIVFGSYNGTVQGKFTAHYSPLKSSCGGYLSSEEGTIASPNYPQSYPVGTSCEWTLNTSPGNRAYIMFEQFDLEYSENCNDDYLEVRENDGGGRLIGVYCGSVLPTNTTIGSKLYVKFHSDSKNSRKGFVIHYGFLHGNEITDLNQGEISSPLYPQRHEGAGDFSWRVTVDGTKIININLDRVEIPSNSDQCDSSLTIYDGYDDGAPILDESCGMLLNHKELRSTSNVVFMKFTSVEDNAGALFHLRWTSSDTDIDHDSLSIDKVNCGSNETETVKPGQSIAVTSPNYPDSYNDDSNCEWVFKASDGNRVSLHFDEVRLEQTPNCFADYISIFSSESPAVWKPVKENICLSEQTEQNFNATSYMKVIFHSDSSIRRQGFKAKVSAVCGGLSKGLSGTVGPTWQEAVGKRIVNCDYTIKVRSGRVIVLSFDVFNITNPETACVTYVILRNGDSSEAPLLADGRYCGYGHENKTNIESSSNVVHVSFRSFLRDLSRFQTFRLRYEEKGIECGATSTLDSDHSWEVLNSPKYPSTPSPYTECTWVYSGPPGEILRVDFIDRFDLDRRKDCSLEYVEVRDGGTDLAPLLGRFCEEKPSTIKSSSNIVYIKYHTQLEEPRNGFKANVSLDYCGGTIRARRGEVTSPGFPSLPNLQYGTVCEWKIIGSSRQVFLIQPQVIELPEPESHCGTKITIEETMPVNNSITILETYCIGDEDEELNMGPIETSSNQVSIKLHVGRPAGWLSETSFKGFRFTFNSSQPMCGGDVSTSEGYIETPGYPRETSVRYCQWRITVPNKMRRIRLEILDSDAESHRIGISNDLHFQTFFQVLQSKNSSENVRVFESSGPTMALYLFLDTAVARHRFRAKFESNLPALCGGPLTGEKGTLASPDLDQSYTCDWHYSANGVTNSSQFKTLLINAKVNSSSTNRNKQMCSFNEPRIIIKPHQTSPYASLYRKFFCGNTETSFRIPSTAVDIYAVRNKINYFSFYLEWKLQPCGGVIHIDETEVNILDIPLNVNDTIDCAWSVSVPYESKLQIKLDGSFELDCNNEFLQIGQSIGEDTLIAEYCKDKSQDNPLITGFRFLMIQYHSNKLNKRSLKVMAKTVTNHCGGVLMDYQRLFESPNYPKNYPPSIECVWEIKSSTGFTISLNFVNRFAIEDRANCTKDAVIIYDWRSDEYVEMARVCGRVLPPVFNSTNNRMKVVLRSDAGSTLDGFRAIWTPMCGGKFNATNKEQILYSPGYPSAYSANQECNYEISGNGKKVSFKVLDFELEGNYPGCEYDNLTIKATFDYNLFFDTYCGTELPAATHEFDKIKLNFRSDRYVERRGFKISYKIYNCNSRITEPTLISTGDSDSYANNENCTWSIIGPTDKNVIIKFQEIATEAHNDYIAVYNGLNIDINKRLAQWSGKLNNPGILQSDNNTMLVQFVSDSSLNYKGFKAFVYFSYSASVECGGRIDLTFGSKHTLKSPLIGSSAVYENFLDCHWMIKAPEEFILEIEFKSFHIAPCQGVNQTALGTSKCDCDFVEIKDGFNPNDFVIGKYCGHAEVPPKLVSSANLMSVRLSTDGEIQSAGFKALLSVKPSLCGRTSYEVSNTVQIIKSPGYDTGSIPRSMHCVYNFEVNSYFDSVHLAIKYLDVRSGDPDPNQCNKDKLIISSLPPNRNISLGKDFIVNGDNSFFVSSSSSLLNYEAALTIPEKYTFCGIKKNLDLYFSGSVTVNLQTAPDDDTLTHKGVEIHVVLNQACGRNYTDLSGRIKNSISTQTSAVRDCYTLITAPENYTISLHFIELMGDYWNEVEYLDIYDGDKTTANKLLRIQSELEEKSSVFSNGRYLLLHNHFDGDSIIEFDANYLQTNKGRGCGGKLHNLLGKVTSPLYPSVYREKNTCEWELETTPDTKLRLHFTVFDLGRICDQNYLQLVDRNGKVISTYCEETPADYISNDNYVKIVFVTTKNNSGTGWVADFIGII